jgi:Ca2+-binding EF-hand superfamily protein
LEEMVKKIDKNGNGFVDFDEFLHLVAPYFVAHTGNSLPIEVRSAMWRHFVSWTVVGGGA